MGCLQSRLPSEQVASRAGCLLQGWQGKHGPRAMLEGSHSVPSTRSFTGDAILESWMLDKSASAPALNSCNCWPLSHKLFLAGRLSLELLELPNSIQVDQVSKLGSNFK